VLHGPLPTSPLPLCGPPIRQSLPKYSSTRCCHPLALSTGNLRHAAPTNPSPHPAIGCQPHRPLAYSFWHRAAQCRAPIACHCHPRPPLAFVTASPPLPHAWSTATIGLCLTSGLQCSRPHSLNRFDSHAMSPRATGRPWWCPMCQPRRPPGLATSSPQVVCL
jgi:hypothetical protein